MEDSTIYESKKRPRNELVHDPCSPDPKRSRVDSVAEDSELNQDDPVAESPELNQSDSVPEDPDSDRVDSVTDTPESYRVDSVDNDRFDSVIQEPESPDTIQLTEEILDILEDTDIDTTFQDLDSVIKSFESEITNPFPVPESGELDYLLGASDDELGLPPANISPSNTTPENKSTESVNSPCEHVEIREDFAFVDELPVYDSVEFGLGEDNYERNEFVTLGNELFEYSETPDYLWHPESLTAL